MLRLAPLLLALTALGCSPGPACGNPEQLRGCNCDDPSVRAACLAEAGLTDASTDGDVDASVCDPSGTDRWYELGYCFEAPRCCASSDCAAGFACSPHGRCAPTDPICSCARDADCGSTEPARQCLTNEVVCGSCIEPRPSCAATPCAVATDACEDGYCIDTTAPCSTAPLRT